jgi:uncharacterized protein with von Willebrand factor type A (vWA) domain
MLIDFFLHLKAKKLPVSTREFLTLLEALQEHVAGHSIDDFYFLARTCLVKDETHYDKFDKAFGEYFKGVTQIPGLEADIPEDWLRLMMKKHLTPEEKAKLEKLGWDKLMEEFKKRLAEQKERHAGGSKWIGTGGSSPFGARRLPPRRHPHRRRIGRQPHRDQGLGKPRVPQPRRQGRTGHAQHQGRPAPPAPLRPRRRRGGARPGRHHHVGTARNAGWLDILMRPERHNKVKVLLFLDIGGSMDDHIRSARNCSRRPRASSSTSSISTSTTASTTTSGATTGAAMASASRCGT